MKWLSGIFTRAVKAFSKISWILRAGLIIFILSGTLDLFYHTVSIFNPGELDPFLGPDGYYVHRALFAGMVLMVIGVMRTRPSSAGRGDNHRLYEKSNKEIIQKEAKS